MALKLTAATALALTICMPAQAGDPVENPLIESAIWTDFLSAKVAGEAGIGDASGLFTVDAPYRAHDAATVPIVIRQTDASVPINAATVVIDENPAPVAAEIGFGPAMQPVEFEFRVRVNQYSNVRVIAETPEGLAMTGRFVKASGGCSAPATKDPEAALAGMGDMRLRLLDAPEQSTPRREAQIMIRHPNYSGLQRDQVTQLFIPAHFIDRLEVRQGDDLLFTVEGGISISENPVFRFTYTENGAPAFSIRATDTDGNTFVRELSKLAQG